MREKDGSPPEEGGRAQPAVGRVGVGRGGEAAQGPVSSWVWE